MSTEMQKYHVVLVGLRKNEAKTKPNFNLLFSLYQNYLQTMILGLVELFVLGSFCKAITYAANYSDKQSFQLEILTITWNTV